MCCHKVLEKLRKMLALFTLKRISPVFEEEKHGNQYQGT